jgi:hypothetical protein
VMTRLQEMAEKAQEFSQQTANPSKDGQIREESTNA